MTYNGQADDFANCIGEAMKEMRMTMEPNTACRRRRARCGHSRGESERKGRNGETERRGEGIGVNSLLPGQSAEIGGSLQRVCTMACRGRAPLTSWDGP
eukprot:scaffold240917_cov30-Tisochrysis_lutea.AAC.4